MVLSMLLMVLRVRACVILLVETKNVVSNKEKRERKNNVLSSRQLFNSSFWVPAASVLRLGGGDVSCLPFHGVVVVL
jgi:hypothetical protein